MASDFQRRQLSGGFLNGFIRVSFLLNLFVNEAIEQVSQELQEGLSLVEPLEGVRLRMGWG